MRETRQVENVFATIALTSVENIYRPPDVSVADSLTPPWYSPKATMATFPFFPPHPDPLPPGEREEEKPLPPEEGEEDRSMRPVGPRLTRPEPSPAKGGGREQCDALRGRKKERGETTIAEGWVNPTRGEKS